MDTFTLHRVRETLEKKRQFLLEWLGGTPTPQKTIQLGTGTEPDARERLHQLDRALAQAENNTLGVCTVCHEFVGEELLEMDFTACVCIDHYSDEQKRRLEQDLELSHKVQKALLPKAVPVIPGLRLAAFMQPAEIVGGDYIDFLRFNNGGFGIAIADVMGKGLSASMVVAGLQASLRILVPQYDSPDEVITRLNQLFRNNVQVLRFISIVLARYDPDSNILEYCNAGHNPPLRWRSGETTVERLMPTGPAIGLTESATYARVRVPLDIRDALLFYTDGLTEARAPNGTELGESLLREWLASSRHDDPKDLLAELRSRLVEFSGSHSFGDDLTMVAARRVG